MLEIPRIAELLNSEILEIVRSYFPGNFEVSHVAAWRNYHLGKYGNFNVGWLAFKNSLESLALLDWWATKCIESTSSSLVKKCMEIKST